jgi:hypothetical protein
MAAALGPALTQSLVAAPPPAPKVAVIANLVMTQATSVVQGAVPSPKTVSAPANSAILNYAMTAKSGSDWMFIKNNTLPDPSGKPYVVQIDNEQLRVTARGGLTDRGYRFDVVRAVNGVVQAHARGATITVASSTKPGEPKMTAPSGTINDIQPTFRWQAASGATSYYLYVNVAGNVYNKVFSVDGLTGTSYRHNAALAAGSYEVWVQALNQSGHTWSKPLTFTVANLAVPTNLRWLMSPTHVDLAWNRVNGAAGYDIYRYQGGAWKFHGGAGNATTYRLRSPETTDVAFAVVAWDATRWNYSYLWVRPPSPPARLYAEFPDERNDRLLLSWTAVPGATGYRLWMIANDTSEQYNVIKNAGPTETTYLKTELIPKRYYTFRVEAFTLFGSTGFTYTDTVWMG